MAKKSTTTIIPQRDDWESRHKGLCPANAVRTEGEGEMTENVLPWGFTIYPRVPLGDDGAPRVFLLHCGVRL
jgi:hypothetical protein